MRRAFVLLLIAGLLAGCSNAGEDPLQVANNASAARPAAVPLTKQPAGTRVPTGAPVLDTAISHGTLFVATPDELRRYDPADPTGPPRTVRLPGRPGRLTAVPEGVLVPVPSAHTVLTVPAGGRPSSTHVQGAPTGALRTGDGALLAAIPDRSGVAELRDGKQTAFITGKVAPEQLFDVRGSIIALDRKHTALYEVDLAKREFGTGMRAGQGASMAATDQYGRILVTDARTDELLAFTTGPLLLRQRLPIGKTPFGIAYDRARRLIWVTLTGSNEVAAYGVGHGQPELKHRFPTVGSPDSVAVDPRDGTVFVGSAAHDGLAVVRP